MLKHMVTYEAKPVEHLMKIVHMLRALRLDPADPALPPADSELAVAARTALVVDGVRYEGGDARTGALSGRGEHTPPLTKHDT